MTLWMTLFRLVYEEPVWEPWGSTIQVEPLEIAMSQPSSSPHKKNNRLLHEASLYLRKHAYNPINWYAWGEEALKRATELDFPIFLSIGYSSCHWCTVMENEAFSDPAIADFMNEHYVSIKVDREERPDLDSIYMQSLQLMTGQGGWPMNVFLTPQDLIPFYGGTYFPIEARYGRPAFMEILDRIQEFYHTEKDKIQTHKTQILSALQQATHLAPLAQIEPKTLRAGLEQCQRILQRGGPGPNFPMIPYAEAMLRASRFADWQPLAEEARQRAEERTEDLVLGGIFDHAGGGFHRYTVDGTWTVPHFEKMLYDNGQILEFISDLWRAGTQEPAIERAVQKTVQWLDREMTSPQGYFYAAQDADSEGEEGKYYVWSHQELEQALTAEEFQLLKEQFDVTANGNFEGHIVLQRMHLGKLPEVLEGALDKLHDIRLHRIPPVTDTKLIVAWNALQVSGLVKAALAFNQSDYLTRAARCLTFILEHLQPKDRLHRIYYGDNQPITVLAKSEDYALLIKALLDCYEATQETHWLEQAQSLQSQMDELLWDLEMGGYFNTSGSDSKNLILREKDYQDNATPSAHGIAVRNLVRLFSFTDDQHYRERAYSILLLFGQIMQELPRACPSLLSGLDEYLNQAVIKGSQEVGHSLLHHYWPSLSFKKTSDSHALVCRGLECLTPATSPQELQQQIRQSITRTSL
jgi:uncharacterized protein